MQGLTMIDSLVAQWRALPPGGALALAFAIHLAIYLGIAALVALPYVFVHRVLGRGALLDPRPLRPGQVRRELGWALSTCAVYAVCLLICLRLSIPWATPPGCGRSSATSPSTSATTSSAATTTASPARTGTCCSGRRSLSRRSSPRRRRG